ncbi:patatin-like phospholipase family protein [Ideonella sp. 4Y11]|uniref:Patatin-like phospholipase family protein n=1 Tax=Ideonella aquatica TaxID=2824119 RepID=A0A940YFE2_9BURK|nr:patatin-like phospholipase family protein [Ideonella aquatica]
MDEHCDLVMKGGITSGVVYPRLVAELATRYRFKNIGGTSAGAIAAGACAAAEYGRRHGHDQAFEQLGELPQQLGEPITPEGRTRLFSLFRPTPALRRHFAVMVGALNAGPRDAARAVLWSLVKMQAGLVLLALALGSVLLWPLLQAVAPALPTAAMATGGATAMAVCALAAALASRALLHGHALRAAGVATLAVGALAVFLRLLAPDTGWPAALGHGLAVWLVALLWMLPVLGVVGWRFGRGLLAGLHANGYGLCSGQGDERTPTDQPALTDWLTGYFNTLAGKAPDGPPLRFGELWGHDDPEQPREINLEVMTSAVSQQMVYGIPLRPGTPRFFYDPVEWARLFPPAVMQALDEALRAHPEGDGSEPLREGSRVLGPEGRPLRPLPRRADWPVVVAVRMSLSFPVLLSAVPLYAIDWSLKSNAQCRQAIDAAATPDERAAHPLQAKRIWFSDGGIGSNMPLHLFDALLPGHPTFAVNLKTAHPDYPIHDQVPGNEGGRVYLPVDNRGGSQRFWNAPNDAAPLGGLVGFLASIVDTMQNWRDEIQFPYPGFRDRIVQISQRPDEGGLNLDMPPKNIEALSGAGAMAAARLIDRFHPAGAEGGEGWRNHEQVRLGTFLGTVQPGSASLAPSLASGEWTPLLKNLRYDAPQRALAGEFMDVLNQLAQLGPDSGLSLESGALKPLAQIRITPRI